METIGKIKLDLSHYPGEDFYCDGEVEEELLAITRDHAEVELPGIIEETASWPILYHLSVQRENIVEWLPITKSDKVLEIGSGCGAITGVLSRKAGSVTCVDLSKKRSTINANRHSDCENVTIHVGNFKDIEPDLETDFDYICLIGVFEYGQSYMGSDTPFEDFLNIIKRHVKKDGRIIIAIENKMGLKYFAGCKEDHLGTFFSGIENYAAGGGVRTFTRPGLEKIMKACQVKEHHFYYPYPDYKFMTNIYSDEYLPKKGELNNNLRNFDRDRMLLFDEKNAFDGMIDDGLFPLFSNSYLVVIGPGVDTKYARYSNDRINSYAIKTEISMDNAGNKQVKKYPLSEEGFAHIRKMEDSYQKLSEKFAGSKMQINRCQVIEENGVPVAYFDFVEGKMLSELMDECLERKDTEGFRQLFEEYLSRISYQTELPVADYDLIFSNILVDGDNWTIIDYEWTYDKVISVKELAFRALYCYLLESESRNEMDVDSVLESLGIKEQDAADYREEEMKFQKSVTGKRLSMAELREKIGYKLFHPEKFMREDEKTEHICKVQVYEDKGAGYSEEDSYFLSDAFVSEKEVCIDISFDGNVVDLRIDPVMDSCIVMVEELTINGVTLPDYSKKFIEVNGKTLKGEKNGFVFPTVDPNINIHVKELDRKAENNLHMKLEVIRIPVNVAENVAQSVKKIF